MGQFKIQKSKIHKPSFEFLILTFELLNLLMQF